MLEEKLKTIDFNINGISQLNKQNLDQIKKNNDNMSELRDYLKRISMK